MPLVTIIIVLIVVGVLLWAINNYLPLDGKIKRIINIVVVLFVVIWLLKISGLLSHINSVRI